MRVDLDGHTPAAGVSAPDLPVPFDSFVGREAELDRLERLVRRHRLVTLVGPAGAGKTRLASQFGTHQRNAGWDRVVFVELNSVTDGDSVPRAVASAFGVKERAGEPITETLVDALRAKPALLVLDGCEHLVDSCALFAETALRCCRNLRLLVTSREDLRVSGEVTLPLSGMSFPHKGGGRYGRAELLQFDAVRLFVDRARRVVPGFELTDDDLEDLEVVCARLDGLPLAIELAARWVGTLPLSEIRASLDDRFRFLVRGGPTVPARQQSLREAIAWSYQLLAAEERMAFRRLSVLAGDFDLVVATVACVATDLDSNTLLDLIARLQAKSLLIPIPETGRFRQLESIRLYGRECLASSGEQDATYERLVSWLTQLSEPLIHSPLAFPVTTRRQLDKQYDSLCVAVEWTASRHDERHMLLATAMAASSLRRGCGAEGRRMLSRALAHTGCRPDYRFVATDYAAWIAVIQGDHDEALRLVDEALSIARELDDSVLLTSALMTLSRLQQAAGQPVEAAESLSECVRLVRQLDQPMATAMCLSDLAWVYLLLGEHEQAALLIDEVLPIYRRAGMPHSLAAALHSAGLLALSRGDLHGAEATFIEALRTDPSTVQAIAPNVEGLAIVASRRAQAERALRLAFAVENLRRVGQVGDELAWQQMVNEAVGVTERQLSQQQVQLARKEAERMTHGQLISYALDENATGQAGQASSVLDERELRIAALVAAGFTNRQIASRLSLSQRTVIARLERIRDKVGLESRAEVADWATQHEITLRNLGTDG